MRFARLMKRNGDAQRGSTRSTPPVRRNAGRRGAGALASALLAAGGLGMVTGCDTKGFLDPGEMGRYNPTPLTVQILDNIDAGIEDPKIEFVNAVPPTQDDLIASNLDYRISKNDLIQVEINELNGPGTVTTKPVRVSESGRISLPFIDQVQAEGYTEAELEELIKKTYRDKNILQNAQVSVSVVERRGGAFSILGAVARPGQYAIFEPEFRILDALTVAGDAPPLLEDIYIIRRTDLGRAAPAGGNRPAPVPGTGGPGTGGRPTVPTTGPDDLAPPAPRTMARPASPNLASRNYPQNMGPGLAPGMAPGYTRQPVRQPVGAVATAAGVSSPTVLPQRRGPAVHLADDPGDVAPGAAGTRPSAPAAGGDRLLGNPPGTPSGAAPGIDAEHVLVNGRPVYIGPASRPAGEAAGSPAGTSVAPATFAPTPAGAGETAPTAAPAPVAPAAAGGTIAGTSSSGSSRGGFQFNDIQAPSNIKVIRVPLDRLRNGEMQYNLVVRPKDTLIVQNLPIGEYYVSGHVARPGAYSLTGRKITLKQAIAAANMLDGLAIPERTDVIRRLPGGREVWVRVNLAKIYSGEQSDIFLKPDDQVHVGTNGLAPFLAALRGAFRITYGFGFLYDRNFAVDQRTGSSL